MEEAVHAYVADEHARAFQVASTLRQFTEIWDLEREDERGRDLVNILRARLAQLPGGALDLTPAQVQRVREAPSPSNEQLQAVLGTEGTRTYQWWKTGLDRAVGVAAVRARLGGRIGTGFLVRGGDLGLPAARRVTRSDQRSRDQRAWRRPGDSARRSGGRLRGGDRSRIRFRVSEIVWSRPVEAHDATLVRLARPVLGIPPLPVARALPLLDEGPRVYVIGHPGGRDLAFSFQDNELIDHEGPPAGKPPIPGVCRVHYRAPTEGGSSGSPGVQRRALAGGRPAPQRREDRDARA